MFNLPSKTRNYNRNMLLYSITLSVNVLGIETTAITKLTMERIMITVSKGDHYQTGLLSAKSETGNNHTLDHQNTAQAAYVCCSVA
jgi:hypothetical protein